MSHYSAEFIKGYKHAVLEIAGLPYDLPTIAVPPVPLLKDYLERQLAWHRTAKPVYQGTLEPPEVRQMWVECLGWYTRFGGMAYDNARLNHVIMDATGEIERLKYANAVLKARLNTGDPI